MSGSVAMPAARNGRAAVDIKGGLMRVKTLTLATAALTFGLAAPALASPTLGEYQGMRTQASLQRGGGDCDGDGGCADSDSFSGHRHCGSFGSCGHLFGHGPLSGFGGGFGGGGFGGGGGGDRVAWDTSGGWCCAAKHARVPARVAPPPPALRRPLARPGRVIVHRRQVMRVPRRAVPTGFGGSQGMNLPLGIAGMSLILGGAGLLPLARRRIRTSERS
jgi:hypothetical protein